MRLAGILKIDRLSALNNPITIAGGGLAGLSLGIALQSRGVHVTIHEASTYPRHRVCGEFISGVSEETLGTLGIACLQLFTHQGGGIGWATGGFRRGDRSHAKTMTAAELGQQ